MTVIHSAVGEFRIENISPGIYTLIAVSTDLGISILRDISVERDSNVDLGRVSLSGHLAAGHVVDETGTRVAGATVYIGTSYVSDEGSDLHHALRGEFIGQTDISGEFRFDGVTHGVFPPAQQYVWATHPERGASERTRLDGSMLKVVLRRAASVEGEASGERFLAVRISGPVERLVMIEPHGTFIADALPPGDYKFEFLGRPGEHALEKTVHLPPGKSVRLRVDDGGAP